MKIALAQINSWLGDFAGNRDKILSFIERARRQGAELVVFPEAALFGYHPCDLLERPRVVEAQLKELDRVHRQIPKGMGVLVGAIGLNHHRYGKPYHNSAVFLEKGKAKRWFAKQLLPTYDVFDEGRHIEPGRIHNNVFKWRGKKILVTVCEDIWGWPTKQGPRFSSYMQNPLKDVKRPVDLVLNLSASPFTETKWKQRRQVTRSTAQFFRAPMVYVNMVGAQDELIFDGASFAISPRGEPLIQCEQFDEDLKVLEILSAPTRKPLGKWTLGYGQATVRDLRRALALGLRDFVKKQGVKKVHLGLSGGVDSAVVACLAAEALGPERVMGVGLPGPYSAPESLTLARELAKRLGIDWHEVAIVDLYERTVKALEKEMGPTTFGVMHENLQARLRATILMAFANRENSFLLGTSNKSELATGYSTLYGDMCGALMPIGDLLKREVYDLARDYNRHGEVIPEYIIQRPPTAELRANQRDDDSLPPYSELDPIVEKLVEGYRPAGSAGEKKILSMLLKSEFKRWQAPPILKVTDHAFGRGRRLPLAHKAVY